MKTKAVTLILALVIFSIAAPVNSFGQKWSAQKEAKPRPREYTAEELAEMSRRAEERRNINKTPSSDFFYISSVGGNPDALIIVLANADKNEVSQIFHIKQVLVFEALMNAAKEFAQTEESVGANKPLTTQFFDKQVPAFIVDVTKMGSESRFFITIKGFNNKVTLDAGAIKREDRETVTVFHDILSRLQAALDNPR